jgi:predicted lactoylglutathione lyase
MLLDRARFASFSKRPIGDSRTETSALFALTVDSRAAVDEMVATAVAAGGSRALDPVDHGFMYVSTFYDLDGHHWEIFWMDPSAIPG